MANDHTSRPIDLKTNANSAQYGYPSAYCKFALPFALRQTGSLLLQMSRENSSRLVQSQRRNSGQKERGEYGGSRPQVNQDPGEFDHLSKNPLQVSSDVVRWKGSYNGIKPIASQAGYVDSYRLIPEFDHGQNRSNGHAFSFIIVHVNMKLNNALSNVVCILFFLFNLILNG